MDPWDEDPKPSPVSSSDPWDFELPNTSKLSADDSFALKPTNDDQDSFWDDFDASKGSANPSPQPKHSLTDIALEDDAPVAASLSPAIGGTLSQPNSPMRVEPLLNGIEKSPKNAGISDARPVPVLKLIDKLDGFPAHRNLQPQSTQMPVPLVPDRSPRSRSPHIPARDSVEAPNVTEGRPASTLRPVPVMRPITSSEESKPPPTASIPAEPSTTEPSTAARPTEQLGADNSASRSPVPNLDSQASPRRDEPTANNTKIISTTGTEQKCDVINAEEPTAPQPGSPAPPAEPAKTSNGFDTYFSAAEADSDLFGEAPMNEPAPPSRTETQVEPPVEENPAQQSQSTAPSGFDSYFGEPNAGDDFFGSSPNATQTATPAESASETQQSESDKGAFDSYFSGTNAGSDLFGIGSAPIAPQQQPSAQQQQLSTTQLPTTESSKDIQPIQTETPSHDAFGSYFDSNVEGDDFFGGAAQTSEAQPTTVSHASPRRTDPEVSQPEHINAEQVAPAAVDNSFGDYFGNAADNSWMDGNDAGFGYEQPPPPVSYEPKPLQPQHSVPPTPFQAQSAPQQPQNPNQPPPFSAPQQPQSMPYQAQSTQQPQALPQHQGQSMPQAAQRFDPSIGQNSVQQNPAQSHTQQSNPYAMMPQTQNPALPPSRLQVQGQVSNQTWQGHGGLPQGVTNQGAPQQRYDALNESTTSLPSLGQESARFATPVRAGSAELNGQPQHAPRPENILDDLAVSDGEDDSGPFNPQPRTSLSHTPSPVMSSAVAPRGGFADVTPSFSNSSPSYQGQEQPRQPPYSNVNPTRSHVANSHPSPQYPQQPLTAQSEPNRGTYGSQHPAGFADYHPAPAPARGFSAPQQSSSFNSHQQHPSAQAQPTHLAAVPHHSPSLSHTSPYASFGQTSSPGRQWEPPPAHAVARFGFGGKLIVMFPRQVKRLNVFSSSGPADYDPSSNKLRPGEVRVHSVVSLMSNTPYAKSMTAFPGPLKSKATSPESIAEAITTICDADRSSAPNSDEKLLWNLLKVMTIQGGHLHVPADRNQNNSQASEVVRQLMGSSQVQANRDEGAWINNSENRYSALQNLGPILHEEYQPQRDVASDERTISEIQRLAVLGRRKEATQLAVTHKLWEHALLLSSFTDVQTYNHVVCSFAKSTFRPGTPLESLYLVLARSEQVLFQTLEQDNDPSQPPRLVTNWRQNLAVIMANRSKNDQQTVVKLGDFLRHKYNRLSAAHACYLLAEHPVHEKGWGSRVLLFGGDHHQHPRSFCDPQTIQRTEVFEFCRTMTDPGFTLYPFVIFKFVYAHMLADLGLVDVALQYMEVIHQQVMACQAANKKNKEAFHFSNSFLLSFNEFESRLRHHTNNFKGPSMAQKVSSTVKSLLGKTLQFMVGESDDGGVAHAVPASGGPSAHSTQPPFQPIANQGPHSVSPSPAPSPTALEAPLMDAHRPVNNNNVAPSHPQTPGHHSRGSNQSAPARTSQSVPTTPADKQPKSNDAKHERGPSLISRLTSWLPKSSSKKKKVKQASLDQDYTFQYVEGRGYVFLDKDGNVVEEKEEKKAPPPPPKISQDMKERLEAAKSAGSNGPSAPSHALPGLGPRMPARSKLFSSRGTGVTSRYAVDPAMQMMMGGSTPSGAAVPAPAMPAPAMMSMPSMPGMPAQAAPDAKPAVNMFKPATPAPITESNTSNATQEAPQSQYRQSPVQRTRSAPSPQRPPMPAMMSGPPAHSVPQSREQQQPPAQHQPPQPSMPGQYPRQPSPMHSQQPQQPQQQPRMPMMPSFPQHSSQPRQASPVLGRPPMPYMPPRQ